MKNHPFYLTLSAFISMVLLVTGTRALATPLKTGQLLVNNILDKGLENWYGPVCSYYGVMIFSEAINDPCIIDEVIDDYYPYLTGARQPRKEGHVDNNVFGIVPFELYRQTGNADYLPLAQEMADLQFNSLPDPPPAPGLCDDSRFWVDDMYMVGSLQTQAYKSLQDLWYINNAVNQLLGYIEDVKDLQQPNGLFHHTYRAPYHWGRGNGWAAAAMTETLLAMPLGHPQRAQLLAAYKRMMDALVFYQHSSGLWYQLLDMPDDPRNWLETSCTGMFVFALATGVDQGWLVGTQYHQAAVQGWLGLESHIRANGDVEWICEGTSEGFSADYYFNRNQRVGDMHGQAGAIWAATAMVRSGLIPEADFNLDGSVDFVDFSQFAQHWRAGTGTTDVQAPLDPCSYWALDENAGTLAHDSTSWANHGTLVGAAWAPTEGMNGAAHFGQTDGDRVEIPTTTLSTDQGTISLWANLAADPQPTRHRYIFGHGTSPYWSNRIQLYLNDGDRQLDLGLGDSHTRSTNIETLQTETWHHIALTWDHVNFILYVDGLPETSGTYTGFNNLNPFADIGNDGRTDGEQRDEAFHGLIDDVRFYDYALSTNEIAYLADLTEVILPFPEESIPYDLHRDERIDEQDLEIFAEMWLWGK